MVTSLELLTSDRMGSVLQAVLTGQQHGTVPGFTYNVDRVQDRPGAETSVTYHVWYDTPARRIADYLVATTADVNTGVRVVLDGHTINAWRHPADPYLPMLPQALDPAYLTHLVGSPIDVSAIEVPVYRPLRRAVAKFSNGRDTWFAKILRPAVAPTLITKHQLFDQAGIGPAVTHADPSGLLVMGQAPGHSLATALSGWQLGQWEWCPGPSDVIAALRAIPAGIMDAPTREPWGARTMFYAEAASRLLPDNAHDINALGTRIMELYSTLPTGELVPTHGDCYEANIFVDGTRLVFIDIDNAGPGYLVDDLACLIAHLAVLPQLSPDHYPAGHAVVESWFAECAQHVHPASLAARVAAVLLSLASGTSTEQALHRVELSRAWLARALFLL